MNDAELAYHILRQLRKKKPSEWFSYRPGVCAFIVEKGKYLGFRRSNGSVMLEVWRLGPMSLTETPVGPAVAEQVRNLL